jgi:hypothetical protein
VRRSFVKNLDATDSLLQIDFALGLMQVGRELVGGGKLPFCPNSSLHVGARTLFEKASGRRGNGKSTRILESKMQIEVLQRGLLGWRGSAGRWNDEERRRAHVPIHLGPARC